MAAETKLTVQGDDTSGNGKNTFSYSGMMDEIANLTQQMQEVNADQINWEAELQRIRINNVQNLENIKRKQERELVDQMTKFQIAATEKANRQKEQALEDEYNARMAMDDKLFVDNFGKTKQQYKKEYELRKKNLEAENKLRLKNAEKQAKREAADANRRQITGGKSKVDKTLDVMRAISTKDEYDKDGNVIGQRKASPAEAVKGALAGVANLLSDMAKQLNNTIDKVAGYKSAIDTRLQGLNRTTGGFFGGGSAWDNISKNITGIAGISPLIKQSALAERVSSMVSQGIAFNVEQRAVLQELSGKIATTFDAANGTLLRLVRIQQQDTTAARLGMESALTAFLNNMYQTTEYMSQIASGIKGSLEEAMSLMSGENALSFEYQVQKWLGSLYSTGMSQTAVQGLGGVLGKIASGQLEGITGGGQGTLMIMAANQAGLNITDILNGGLNADSTNELMNAMVDYLAMIYKEAGDSKVIQQQMASVYGMTASDLKAAVSLARSAGIVSRDGLTYASAMGRLNSMADSMYSRTSIGEMMTNAWENVQYTMASGIANNPALYGLYKVASLLDTAAGGIAIPALSVMGNMVDLETTVADLMRAGAMGGSILAGIGTMLSAQGGGGLTGSGILRAAGVGGRTTVTRGNGRGLATTGGASVSESGSYIGNSEGSDVQSKTLADANDSAKAELASATEQEIQTKDIHNDIISIYNILNNVINNGTVLNVNVANTTPIKVEGTGIDRY